MQKSFFNRNLVVILVALIFSFLLIAFSIGMRNNSAAPSFIQSFGNDASAVVDRVVTWPIAKVKNVGTTLSSLTDTYQENKHLKSQLNTLAQTKAENQTLRQENKNLKKQVNLNRTLTDYGRISAYVITRSPSSWQNQIVISEGSNAGVTKNSAVMVDQGLIGRVVEVNKLSSKVELISTTNDSANRFAVQLTNSEGQVVNGLVTDYDKDKGQIVMGQVTRNVKIKKGTRVITSGLGGTTPKGLYVGKVVRVSQAGDSSNTKIYIQPAADLNNLSAVTVAKRAD
ncbi:rod shape-determining protein MreC [Ligilactobacillus equi]|uniref:Cell shape-determining protein MreC n=1 Tax=Ligilactobacillus equi DSM 15833 = JCM 10991 TaxID=1423740 RepID=A0A0R1U1K5_9LACO|nr:rod shape-determining protein MreC [Ligilactobacillus equi]KRL85290.1 rod shape-determining protein [Ligilactobacillus equi DSM 15833 = JCM 10991]MCQ2556405.1 rod shape-determining protein MreC [Ligilactobacillus sp.]